jgi:hypothetical protein
MGIETALLVGGGLVGNYIQKQGEKKAAEAQAQGIQAATDRSIQAQQDYYRQGQTAVRPYQQSGKQALAGIQNLMTTEGQNQFAQDYTSGPMFQQFQQQAEDAALRSASATGGMRTGQTGVALSSIAPQLINQAYQQRLQGLQGLMQQGAASAGQTAGLATGVGTNIGGTAYGGGVAATQPQYAADTAMSDFYGNAVSTLGGVGYDYFAPTQVSTSPGQKYGR